MPPSTEKLPGPTRDTFAGENRFLNALLKLALTLFPQNEFLRKVGKRYVFSLGVVSPEPRNYVPPPTDLTQKLALIGGKNKKVLLTGRAGTGKTALALETHRQLLENESDVVGSNRLLPVVVNASASKFKGPHGNRVMEMISHSVASRREFLRRRLAKRLVNSGSLLLIFDDLDYLDNEGLKLLEEFVQLHEPQNTFICISRNKPKDNEFWGEFETISLAEWGAEQYTTYVKSRVVEDSQASDFLTHLGSIRDLPNRYTAYEWKCLVDTYLDDRIFEVFHAPNHASLKQYRLSLEYLKIRLNRLTRSISDSAMIENLGALSFDLLLRSRRDFEPHECSVDHESLQALSAGESTFLSFDGTRYWFANGTDQLILAGLHLARRDRVLLEQTEGDQSNLVWTPVYNCARAFVDDRKLTELNKSFVAIANRQRQYSLVQPRPSRHGSPIDKQEIAILESQSRSLFDKLSEVNMDSVKLLGLFSLQLISVGNTSFSIEEGEKALGEQVMAIIRPAESRRPANFPVTQQGISVVRSSEFFNEIDGMIRFAQSEQQAYFAAKYVAEYWPESETHFRHAAERRVKIVQDVCNFASKLVVKEDSLLELCERMFALSDPKWKLEWPPVLERKFQNLVKRDALGDISKSELEDLKRLSNLRRRVVAPRSSVEIESDRKRSEEYENFKQALDRFIYVLEHA